MNDATGSGPRSTGTVLPARFVGDVVLEAIGSRHLPLEQELSRRPDVVRWTYYMPDLTDEQALSRIRWSQEQASAGRGQRYVVEEARGEYLGTAGIAGLDGQAPELFYALLPAARGRGAATEAVRLLTAWAHANGYPELHIVTLEGNEASERVARRASYERVRTEAGEHRGEPAVLVRWVHRSPWPRSDRK